MLFLLLSSFLKKYLGLVLSRLRFLPCIFASQSSAVTHKQFLAVPLKGC